MRNSVCCKGLRGECTALKCRSRFLVRSGNHLRRGCWEDHVEGSPRTLRLRVRVVSRFRPCGRGQGSDRLGFGEGILKDGSIPPALWPENLPRNLTLGVLPDLGLLGGEGWLFWFSTGPNWLVPKERKFSFSRSRCPRKQGRSMRWQDYESKTTKSEGEENPYTWNLLRVEPW